VEIAFTNPDLKFPVNFNHIFSFLVINEEQLPGAAWAVRIAHHGMPSGQAPIYRFTDNTHAFIEPLPARQGPADAVTGVLRCVRSPVRIAIVQAGTVGGTELRNSDRRRMVSSRRIDSRSSYPKKITAWPLRLGSLTTASRDLPLPKSKTTTSSRATQ
jgi:hypothetical protein